MKTTFKFAGLSALLFGQSLCLLAQTAWHNPAADSLLPIQGRAWNAETGKAYQRLPQRAEQLVGNHMPLTDAACRCRQQDSM